MMATSIMLELILSLEGTGLFFHLKIGNLTTGSTQKHFIIPTILNSVMLCPVFPSSENLPKLFCKN